MFWSLLPPALLVPLMLGYASASDSGFDAKWARTDVGSAFENGLLVFLTTGVGAVAITAVVAMRIDRWIDER